MNQVRVLIVEDESIIAKGIEKRLIGLGYAVAGKARNGEQAIQTASELQPDVILMDIRLGSGMDGIEAARVIRSHMDVPIIYLTAHSDDATLQRAKVTEPYGYILKPHEDTDLHTAIEIGLYKHRMQRHLRENEEWLSATLSSIGDGVIATDDQGPVRFMNALAQCLTGWTIADALGKEVASVFNIVHKETRQPARNRVLEAMSVSQSVAICKNTILINRAGIEYDIDDSAAPIRDVNGNIAGAVLVFRDITERHRLEEAKRQIEEEKLRLAEERFSLLVRVVQDYAIYILDTEGRVTTWNPGAERIKRYSSEEIIGQHFSRFYVPEDVQNGKPDRDLLSAITHGECIEEGWQVRSDGTQFWASVVTTALRDQAGNLQGFARLTRDLTQRRLEMTIMAKNHELMRAIQTKDLFLAGMSHELRTPLNAIIGYTGILLMRLPGPLTPEQESQLLTVEKSAQHLLALVTDLLDLAKVESGKVDLKLEAVDLQNVIDDVATMMRPFAERKRIRLESDTRLPAPIVRGDKRMVAQILVNLVTNAIKFTEEGSVVLELDQSQETVRRTEIRVRDTGIGISVDDQARLFTPYLQLDSSIRYTDYGTGLGLYLSRKLAELNGASLTLESEIGKGSTFTLAWDME